MLTGDAGRGLLANEPLLPQPDTARPTTAKIPTVLLRILVLTLLCDPSAALSRALRLLARTLTDWNPVRECDSPTGARIFQQNSGGVQVQRPAATLDAAQLALELRPRLALSALVLLAAQFAQPLAPQAMVSAREPGRPSEETALPSR